MFPAPFLLQAARTKTRARLNNLLFDVFFPMDKIIASVLLPYAALDDLSRSLFR